MANRVKLSRPIFLVSAALASLCVSALASPAPADPAPASAPSKEPPPKKKLYFHSELDYGSDSQFHPIQASIHVSFDILRSASYQSNPFEIDYETAFSNVAHNIAHPFDAIDGTGGADEFIAHEVFPYKGLSGEYGQWIPNYSLHMIGEGMLYRKLSSWYEAHNVPAPRLVGLLNLAAAQFMNEVSENGSFTGPNSDPVADFFIFNPLGYILFSFDPVAEFFSTTVKTSYWPDQAAIDITSGRLLNVGSNYSFKIQLPLTDWRLFYYTGSSGLLGLSVPISRTENISLGGGTRMFTMNPRYTDAGGRTMIPDDLQPELGVFWDRNDSLLASVILSGPEHPRIAVNVYPGLLQFQGFTAGFFAAAGHYDGLSAGVTFSWTPLGLGFGMNERTSQQWL